MAYWGRSLTTGSAFTTAFQRAMGGTFALSGQQLNGVEIYSSGDGVAEVRVAVYAGGTPSDPSGATLLEDLGKVTPQTTVGWAVLPSLTNPEIPSGTPIWIYLHGTSATSVIAGTSSAESGDFYSERGRASFASTALSADTAPPATLTTATFANFWYSWRLEYSEISASGPTLSTVPVTAFPGQSRTVSGSGFGPTQGAGGVAIDGVAQIVTAWSDTSITFTTVQGNTKFGAGNDLVVTTDGSQTANGTIGLIVEPGTGGYVDVVAPETADSSSLAFGFEAAGGAPVATGDQCHWVYTGVPGDPTSMTVEPDTLVSALDQEGAVNVRFWDATDSTWGSFAALNATVPVVDTVKPVITILGDNPATVFVGNSYTDAGATASDDVDGSLGSVTGVGSVDTNTIGQYTITYPGAGAVDSAGNVADDATRIVNVVADAPIINIDQKKRKNKLRRQTANYYGAWRNRFMGGD